MENETPKNRNINDDTSRTGRGNHLSSTTSLLSNTTPSSEVSTFLPLSKRRASDSKNGSNIHDSLEILESTSSSPPPSSPPKNKMNFGKDFSMEGLAAEYEFGCDNSDNIDENYEDFEKSQLSVEEDLDLFVSDLLDQMTGKFENMGKSILGRINDMGDRIDNLEESIGDLLNSQGIGDETYKGIPAGSTPAKSPTQNTNIPMSITGVDVGGKGFKKPHVSARN